MTTKTSPVPFSAIRSGLYRSRKTSTRAFGFYEIEQTFDFDGRPVGWELRIDGEWAQTYGTLRDAKIGAGVNEEIPFA